MNFMNLFENPQFWFGVFRSMTPILLAALAAMVATRCGITNMAIEGTMTFSALFGVLGAHWFGSVWLGLLLAILIGVVVSLFLAYFKLQMGADEVLVGIAINLLAAGATIFILYLVTGDKASSSSIPPKLLPFIHIPLIKDIPFIGKVISGQSIIVYFSFVLVLMMNFLLFKTPLGLRIRSVGSNPHASESVGVFVNKTRYIAMLISGILAGIAGAYMSMGYMSIFTKGMIAGRGFIGLAASNVGGVAPFGGLLAALLFGFFESLGNNLQSVSTLPAEFILMIPYITTIIAYTIFSYRRLTAKKRKAKQLAENAAKI
ncbi:MAG: ABC transporter permease [Anaerolineaceae bacterium]|nr:ABC transporter permease [Anaerolineaceae bacterium]